MKAAAYFNVREYGSADSAYSRVMNPTVAAFDERRADPDEDAGGSERAE